MENVEQLVSALLMEQEECPWLEFKSGNFNPEMIGQDISAIANGATLSDRSCGYMLWGVENDTRKIVAAELKEVIIYSNVPFASQTNESRLWALYMHACIKHTQRSQLTNASLRARFGLKPSSAGMISRLIKTAVQKRLIKVFDESASLKFKRYVPSWA